MREIRVGLQRILYNMVALLRDCSWVSLCETSTSKVEMYILKVLKIRVGLCRSGLPEVSLVKDCSGKCILTYIKEAEIHTPYLEISPEIVWVYDNVEAYNDVFSNTTWNVN